MGAVCQWYEVKCCQPTLNILAAATATSRARSLVGCSLTASKEGSRIKRGAISEVKRLAVDENNLKKYIFGSRGGGELSPS
jgi:hypothetical protein